MPCASAAARLASAADLFPATQFRLAFEAATEIVDVTVAEGSADHLVVGKPHSVVEVILHVRTSFGACLDKGA